MPKESNSMKTNNSSSVGHNIYSSTTLKDSSTPPEDSENQSNNHSDNGREQSHKGKAVQIAKITDKKFTLIKETLSNILLKDSIRNKPLVVVSIAGDVRKGKSFMLNFFLRYLQSDCGSLDDWIGRNQSRPLQGFSWRGGSERETIGIMMWSEPFIVKRSDGREVAVLLMDTQGAFDCEETVKNSSIIFALSLLTSSTFIYNLHRNIQENDLDNLHVFSNFGSLVVSEDSIEKPFQKLVFLVRDWSFPYQYKYGKTGGDQLIHKYLVQQKTEINRKPREFIEEYFEEKMGFLLPHPGQIVATNPQFRGKISDIEPEFVELVEQFVPLILSPDNLVIKKIGGLEVSAQHLYQYFSEYSKRFSGDQLPEIQSLLEGTAYTSNFIAADNAFEEYFDKMENLCGGSNPFISEKLFQQNHLKYMDESLNSFDRSPKIGGQELSDPHRNDLIHRIETELERRRAQNVSKEGYLSKFQFPAYILLTGFVCFLLYYMVAATGLTHLANIFFIISTICLGIFIAFIIHLKENPMNPTIKWTEAVLICALMVVISLFLLYWRYVWHFFSRFL